MYRPTAHYHQLSHYVPFASCQAAQLNQLGQAPESPGILRLAHGGSAAYGAGGEAFNTMAQTREETVGM